MMEGHLLEGDRLGTGKRRPGRERGRTQHEALAHLRKADPVMARLISAHPSSIRARG